MLMGIIGWVIVGLIAGVTASKMINLHGDDPGIGIGLAAAGAVAGGFLYSLFSGNAVTGFNIWSLLVAGTGAGLALSTWHLMRWHAATRG